MARTLLDGHDLLHDGSAVDAELLPTGAKTGVGACSCGEVSEELGSTGARRAWYRGHAAQLRAEAQDRG